MASIPACHAGDQGSIPCDGEKVSAPWAGTDRKLFSTFLLLPHMKRDLVHFVSFEDTIPLIRQRYN